MHCFSIYCINILLINVKYNNPKKINKTILYLLWTLMINIANDTGNDTISLSNKTL